MKNIKLKCRFDKEFIALFSNIGNKNDNSFYLLMVYHKSMKGGFNHFIDINTCNKLLKRKNSAFYYVENKI